MILVNSFSLATQIFKQDATKSMDAVCSIISNEYKAIHDQILSKKQITNTIDRALPSIARKQQIEQENNALQEQHHKALEDATEKTKSAYTRHQRQAAEEAKQQIEEYRPPLRTLSINTTLAVAATEAHSLHMAVHQQQQTEERKASPKADKPKKKRRGAPQPTSTLEQQCKDPNQETKQQKQARREYQFHTAAAVREWQEARQKHAEQLSNSQQLILQQLTTVQHKQEETMKQLQLILTLLANQQPPAADYHPLFGF